VSKRLLFSLVVIALGMCIPAFGDSIGIGPANGWGYTDAGPGFSDSFISLGSYSATATTYHSFSLQLDNCCSSDSLTQFSYGNLNDYWSNTKTNSETWINGDLSDVTLKGHELTGLFNGWVYGENKGQWYDQAFSGKFTDNLSLTSYNQSCCGYTFIQLQGTSKGGVLTGVPSGTGMSATPEPGTLAMFGTGLVGIAGIIRRKLKVCTSA
jgi:hypothetical protein